MQAARLPQSKPASATCSSPRASAKSTTSWAIAACSAIRGASGSRKRVVPYPRRYGTSTRYPASASGGATPSHERMS